MQDYVTIANLALGAIGEDDAIISPAEQSKAAREIRNAWDNVRRAVLSKANWSFALRTVELAARPATAADPILVYQSAFPLPANMMKFTEILDDELDQDFSIEAGPNGEELLVNSLGPVKVRYVRDEPNSERWSPAFVDCFVQRLGWQICDAMGGSQTRKAVADKAYQVKLTEARADNNRRKSRRSRAATPFTEARMTGAGTAPNVR